MHLTMLNGSETVGITLKDVLYMPKVQNKLFSLPSVTEKGAAVKFKGQSCGIKSGGKDYTIGHKHGTLYKVNTVSAYNKCCIGNTTTQHSLDWWHIQYGHLGYESLKSLSDKELVNGLHIDPKDGSTLKCEGCAVGKQHRNFFLRSRNLRLSNPWNWNIVTFADL